MCRVSKTPFVYTADLLLEPIIKGLKILFTTKTSEIVFEEVKMFPEKEVIAVNILMQI